MFEFIQKRDGPEYARVATFVACFSFIFGLMAIYTAKGGELYCSLAIIFIAYLLDLLQVPLQTRLGFQQNITKWAYFGANIVTYLLFPVFIIPILLGDVHTLYIIASYIFLFTGIYRLLRFTLQRSDVDRGGKNFEGMPVTASMPLLIFVFALSHTHLNLINITSMLLLILSVLMVRSDVYPRLRDQSIFIALELLLAMYFVFVCLTKLGAL